MFGLGVPELLVIFAIIVVIFGASKLPQLGRGLGEGISNFKKGLKGDDRDTIDEGQWPRITRSTAEPARSPAPSPERRTPLRTGGALLTARRDAGLSRTPTAPPGSCPATPRGCDGRRSAAPCARTPGSPGTAARRGSGRPPPDRRCRRPAPSGCRRRTGPGAWKGRPRPPRDCSPGSFRSPPSPSHWAVEGITWVRPMAPTGDTASGEKLDSASTRAASSRPSSRYREATVWISSP